MRNMLQLVLYVSLILLLLTQNLLFTAFWQRVTRPRGGIHERLHWLPVFLHKKLDHVMKQFQLTVGGQKFMPFSAEKNGSADL